MSYDPSYKLKHKPPKISRLLHWKYLPPRMVGDPPIDYYSGGGQSAWHIRCVTIYQAMMAEKHGTILPYKMRGLWHWGVYDAQERQADALHAGVHAADGDVVDNAKPTGCLNMPGPKQLKPLRPQQDVHIRPSACTNCGNVMDGCTAVTETNSKRKRKVLPDSGDFTICIVCGHLMSFAEDLSLRDPTPEEQIKVAGDRRLLAIMRAIAMAKARMSDEWNEIAASVSERRPSGDPRNSGPGGSPSGLSGAHGKRKDLGGGDDRGGGTTQG